jgi:hypothetical protein
MTVTKEIATNNLQDATISVLANTKNNEWRTSEELKVSSK